MHRGHADYPISILIDDLLDRSGLKTVDFVRFLGYANVSKGIRRLDSWLGGSGKDGFITLLIKAYPEKKPEIDAALAETRKILAQEWEDYVRDSFRPYLRGQCEILPRRTFEGMHYESLMRVQLPQGPISLEEIGALVRAHWELRGGKASKFGRIVRYEYGIEYGRVIIFDILGRKIGEETDFAEEPTPYFSLA